MPPRVASNATVLGASIGSTEGQRCWRRCRIQLGLLIGGDTFKRKLVRVPGPSLTKRKLTVQILDDINASIQKYMLMLLTTNLLVAFISWIAFRSIGLENPGA